MLIADIASQYPKTVSFSVKCVGSLSMESEILLLMGLVVYNSTKSGERELEYIKFRVINSNC